MSGSDNILSFAVRAERLRKARPREVRAPAEPEQPPTAPLEPEALVQKVLTRTGHPLLCWLANRPSYLSAVRGYGFDSDDLMAYKDPVLGKKLGCTVTDYGRAEFAKLLEERPDISRFGDMLVECWRADTGYAHARVMQRLEPEVAAHTHDREQAKKATVDFLHGKAAMGDFEMKEFLRLRDDAIEDALALYHGKQRQ